MCKGRLELDVHHDNLLTMHLNAGVIAVVTEVIASDYSANEFSFARCLPCTMLCTMPATKL